MSEAAKSRPATIDPAAIKVIDGMYGGVDSSVSTLILHQQGIRLKVCS